MVVLSERERSLESENGRRREGDRKTREEGDFRPAVLWMLSGWRFYKATGRRKKERKREEENAGGKGGPVVWWRLEGEGEGNRQTDRNGCSGLGGSGGFL